MRNLTRAVLCRPPLVAAFAPFTRGVVPIFMLHRFADPANGQAKGHDPRRLRESLHYLRRGGYRFLALGDALRLAAERPHDLRRAVTFTVDDGYDDFRRVGWPVFAEFECPVTVFLVSGFLDGECWCWWDRLDYAVDHARRCRIVLELDRGREEFAWSAGDGGRAVKLELIERLKVVPEAARLKAIEQIGEQVDVRWPAAVPPPYAPLSWDDVRSLGRGGVTFGPHTVTHPILSRTTDAQAKAEIHTSWERLRSETDATVPVFCYPNGEGRDFGPREVELVRREGLQAALATQPGFLSAATLARMPYALPRFSYPDERDDLVQIVGGLERVLAGLRGA